jgi:alpha-tubulin suppressor-like RCC1 family protein
VTTPRLINRLEGVKITQVAVGKYHSIAISQNGEVFSWGHHGDIRLGYKCKGPEPFPKRIAGLEGITGGGRIIEKASEAADNRKLGKVVQANAWMVYQIACGSQHTAALTIGGQLWMWGEGEHGALGLGEKEKKDLKEPTLLIKSNITKVIHISCGALHTMAITSNGEVFTW